MLEAAAAAAGVRMDCRVADLLTFDSNGLAFDAVLLDAPCTGLGVLAKRADLRWRRVEADVAASAARALPLLAAAARLARPGGVLVYSTCSTEPEENEGVVEAFLSSSEGAGWTLERADALRLRDGTALPAAALSACGAFLAPLPHVTGTDGAFGARLRRSGDAPCL
jgi:16S rRNA (cytosine967-C5)-methyltransferase